MQNNEDRIVLSKNRRHFLQGISSCRKALKPSYLDETFLIIFDDSLTVDNIHPFHIVLLSCFIEELINFGFSVELLFSNNELEEFLFAESSLALYWSSPRPAHCPSPSISRLNIWRIIENQKEIYSNSVYEYFKRKYFIDYDLSALHNTLNELYFNVFDHANANGNAFSYIQYNENSRNISIAICDFGCGIATSLRRTHDDFSNDHDALLNSIKKGVSARTKPHNKGFGLDSVVNSLGDKDNLKVVSNSALLVCTECGRTVRSYPLEFGFEGTLIYFEISIDSFELEEIFNNAKLY